MKKNLCKYIVTIEMTKYHFYDPETAADVLSGLVDDQSLYKGLVKFFSNMKIGDLKEFDNITIECVKV